MPVVPRSLKAQFETVYWMDADQAVHQGWRCNVCRKTLAGDLDDSAIDAAKAHVAEEARALLVRAGDLE